MDIEIKELESEEEQKEGAMRMFDLDFEFVYCTKCQKEEWHLLCRDGHLECLGCRAFEERRAP